MTRLVNRLFILFVALNVTCVPNLCAQLASGAPAESKTQSAEISPTRFKVNQVNEDDLFLPRKVSPVKMALYPFAVLATPVLFCGYYAFDDEPKIDKSFDSYKDWISYKVPYDPEKARQQEIVIADAPEMGISDKDRPYVYSESYLPVSTEIEKIKEDAQKLRTQAQPKEVKALPKKETVEVKTIKPEVVEEKKEQPSVSKKTSRNISARTLAARSTYKPVRRFPAVSVMQRKTGVIKKKTVEHEKKTDSKAKKIIKKVKAPAPEKKEAGFFSFLRPKTDKEKIIKYKKNARKAEAKGRLEKAKKYYEKVLKVDKNDSESQKKISFIVKAIEDLEKKKEKSVKKKGKDHEGSSIQFKEKDAKRMFLKAESFFKEKKYEEALPIYKKLNSTYPDISLIEKRLKTIEYIDVLFQDKPNKNSAK